MRNLGLREGAIILFYNENGYVICFNENDT